MPADGTDNLDVNWSMSVPGSANYSSFTRSGSGHSLGGLFNWLFQDLRHTWISGAGFDEVRAYLLASFAFTTMAWLLGLVGFGLVCAKVCAHASQLTHPG